MRHPDLPLHVKIMKRVDTKVRGDWNCPKCGDLQFAKNPMCRVCGEPKPFASAPVRWGREEGNCEWNCPDCGERLARNKACHVCSSRRPKPGWQRRKEQYREERVRENHDEDDFRGEHVREDYVEDDFRGRSEIPEDDELGYKARPSLSDDEDSMDGSDREPSIIPWHRRSTYPWKEDDRDDERDSKRSDASEVPPRTTSRSQVRDRYGTRIKEERSRSRARSIQGTSNIKGKSWSVTTQSTRSPSSRRSSSPPSLSREAHRPSSQRSARSASPMAAFFVERPTTCA